jgi:glycine betaine/proline transport system ATP-binding protein
MIRQGKTKDQVLAETGCVVGVNDLSLSIGSGEIFVIMGLSGSGKSTLVRHFNRLIDPTSGEILVDGEDILQYDRKPCANFAGARSAWCSRASACCRTAPCWTTSPTA